MVEYVIILTTIMQPIWPRRFGTSITKIIEHLRRPDQSVMLGRWKLTYCEDKVSDKLHRSNEDHCGICVDPPREETSKNRLPYRD